jgi:hypothetical protein
MKYTDYQNNEKCFYSLTGLSQEQFDELLPYFEEVHNEYFLNYDMNGKYRIHRRSFAIYKNSPLPTIADRLFFILVFLKNNPLQEHHALWFNMYQKHCNSFIHVLRRILEQCLRDPDIMPVDIQKKFVEIFKSFRFENGKNIVLP